MDDVWRRAPTAERRQRRQRRQRSKRSAIDDKNRSKSKSKKAAHQAAHQAALLVCMNRKKRRRAVPVTLPIAVITVAEKKMLDVKVHIVSVSFFLISSKVT
uniref:Uncharacterized protein n=1 Tax=Romanomermis culicivorax TaxID=13658 RepID=A0A915KIC0_ROMCU